MNNPQRRSGFPWICMHLWAYDFNSGSLDGFGNAGSIEGYGEGYGKLLAEFSDEPICNMVYEDFQGFEIVSNPSFISVSLIISKLFPSD